jgi:hypothetical protein
MLKKMIERDLTRQVVKLVITGVCLLALITGCSSNPTQEPEAFIKDFLGKHITMLDVELAKDYIPSERNMIIKQVNATIAQKSEQGLLEDLKKADIDLSNINIEVIDRISAYVDDQDNTYVKVKVTGTYSIKHGDLSENVDENETFILRASGKHWKVTETENPWS